MLEQIINLPWGGSLDIASFSLPALTVIIGLLDGFNPCAMWALVFLLSLLINTKDRRRIWIVGGTFILISGLVYYLFMAAWLNAFLFLGYLTFARWIIGLGAIAFGLYNTQQAIKYRGRCKVASTKSRFKTIEKIKQFAKPRTLPVTLLGVIFLAFSINLIELLCSAGFPAIYTGALSLAQLPAWQYYLYLLGYIIFFMLDDSIVFILAALTMRLVSLHTRLTFISNLIGGIIIIVLGFLLIYKPDILMF